MKALRTPDMTDVQMEEDIHRKLIALGKKFWIQVIARDGYVHLFGFVDGFQQKKEITGIVESFPGVRIVTDHLRIELMEMGAEIHF